MMRGSEGTSSGGQNYLASVSDLVCALIFVFVIMLAVFAYELANVTSDLTAADEVRRRILREVSEKLVEQGIRVEVLFEQGVLRLSDNAINFPSGSETPEDDDLGNVGVIAAALAEVVPRYVDAERSGPMVDDAGDPSERPEYCAPSPRSPPEASVGRPGAADDSAWLIETLLIEGHTDRIPVNPRARYRDNLELSSMRAARVHSMIASCEPDVMDMRNSAGHPILSTSGYGQTRPTQPTTDDPEIDAANRRIDLRFLLEPRADLIGAEANPVVREIGNAIRRAGGSSTPGNTR